MNQNSNISPLDYLFDSLVAILLMGKQVLPVVLVGGIVGGLIAGGYSLQKEDTFVVSTKLEEADPRFFNQLDIPGVGAALVSSHILARFARIVTAKSVLMECLDSFSQRKELVVELGGDFNSIELANRLERRLVSQWSGGVFVFGMSGTKPKLMSEFADECVVYSEKLLLAQMLENRDALLQKTLREVEYQSVAWVSGRKAILRKELLETLTALKVATELGWDKPYANLDLLGPEESPRSGEYLFFLGADVLKARVMVLRDLLERKQFIANAETYASEAKELQLYTVERISRLSPSIDELKAFSVAEYATTSASPVGRSRLQIVLIGVVFGIMASVFLSVVRVFARAVRKRTSANTSTES